MIATLRQHQVFLVSTVIGIAGLIVAWSSLDVAEKSLDFQKSALPAIEVVDFSGYELGSRPTAKIVVTNVSSTSAMTITTSWETDLVSPDNQPPLWQKYLENADARAKKRQQITLAPERSSHRNVVWARTLQAKEIEDLTNLRRALRLAAIVEYIDATGKSKKAYHCVHWHGPVDSFSAYACETPTV